MTRLYNLSCTVCREPLEYWKIFCEDIGEEWEFFEDLLRPVDKKLELALRSVEKDIEARNAKNDEGVRFHKMLGHLGQKMNNKDIVKNNNKR